MTISGLKSRGWIEGKKLEIPKNPCYTFCYHPGNYIDLLEKTSKCDGRVQWKN
jgi:hypothetical protein